MLLDIEKIKILGHRKELLLTLKYCLINLILFDTKILFYLIKVCSIRVKYFIPKMTENGPENAKIKSSPFSQGLYGPFHLWSFSLDFIRFISSVEPWLSRIFKAFILVACLTALGLSIAAFVNSDGAISDDPEFESAAEKEFDKIKNLEHVKSSFFSDLWTALYVAWECSWNNREFDRLIIKLESITVAFQLWTFQRKFFQVLDYVFIKPVERYQKRVYWP